MKVHGQLKQQPINQQQKSIVWIVRFKNACHFRLFCLKPSLFKRSCENWIACFAKVSKYYRLKNSLSIRIGDGCTLIVWYQKVGGNGQTNIGLVEVKTL